MATILRSETLQTILVLNVDLIKIITKRKTFPLLNHSVVGCLVSSLTEKIDFSKMLKQVRSNKYGHSELSVDYNNTIPSYQITGFEILLVAIVFRSL